MKRCKCGKYRGDRYPGIVCDKCFHLIADPPVPILCSHCGKLAVDLVRCGCGEPTCGTCWYEHDGICKRCEEVVETILKETETKPYRIPDTHSYTIHITDDNRVFLEEIP